jgi:hypothetical protein
MPLAFASSLLMPGCNAINPLCNSSRPTPVITSLNPTSVTFAQVLDTFQLTVTGSRFVASSVVIVNGIEVATTVPSNTQLLATVGPAAIKNAGDSNVLVHTPAGNSGDLGCDSGGNSSTLTLTVK